MARENQQSGRRGWGRGWSSDQNVNAPPEYEKNQHAQGAGGARGGVRGGLLRAPSVQGTGAFPFCTATKISGQLNRRGLLRGLERKICKTQHTKVRPSRKGGGSVETGCPSAPICVKIDAYQCVYIFPALPAADAMRRMGGEGENQGFFLLALLHWRNHIYSQ